MMYINIFGTLEITNKIIQMLKKNFEMKDLGKTTNYLGLGLQFDYFPSGILLHQIAYT